MNKNIFFDILERVTWTFIQAFSGIMSGAQVFAWDIPLWEQAVAAGAAAVFSTLKGIAASHMSKMDTASLPSTEGEPDGVRHP